MRWAAVALAVALAGCAPSGHPIDHAKVASFESGRTTYADVVGALGQPNEILTSDNTKAISYSYLTTRTNPAAFLPLAGFLIAVGSGTHTDTVSLTFDANDVLTKDGASISGGTASPQQ